MNKQLIVVNGTMGTGKTTVCRLLLDRLMPGVWLDGDWCWRMNPFVVNAENRAMVLGNISHLLRAYLQNSGYRYVLFSWVMQEDAIWEELHRRLGGLEYRLLRVTLTCSPEALCMRLTGDIQAGLRDPGVITRSLERLPLDEHADTIRIDATS